MQNETTQNETTQHESNLASARTVTQLLSDIVDELRILNRRLAPLDDLRLPGFMTDNNNGKNGSNTPKLPWLNRR